jgi:hypothetical protein
MSMRMARRLREFVSPKVDMPKTREEPAMRMQMRNERRVVVAQSQNHSAGSMRMNGRRAMFRDHPMRWDQNLSR